MLIGVTMIRDEADIIEWTLRHMLAEGVDRLIVADNLSTDDTPAILDRLSAEVGDRLFLVYDPDPAYTQADKMTRLAKLADEMDADWIIPFDADEVFYVPGADRIADVLPDLNCDVVKAWGWDHIARPHTDPEVANPLQRIGWRRNETQRLPKVAFRTGSNYRLHMGNHDVDRAGRRLEGVLEYRHFGFRTFEQMRRKVRNGRQAYEASTLHEMYGAHWRRMGALSDDDLRVEWEALCASTDLTYDPAPVHECRSSSPTTGSNAGSTAA